MRKREGDQLINESELERSKCEGDKEKETVEVKVYDTLQGTTHVSWTIL